MTKIERDRDLTRRCIVEKWALLVAEPTMLEPECPLCAELELCLICPIFAKTGKTHCLGTPYEVWNHTETGKRTSRLAQDMTDWLWALYDELTEKMLAEREADVQHVVNSGMPMTLKTKCIICGDAPKYMSKGSDGEWVCNTCRKTCYDANGHYLVPVVRAGPWYQSSANPWELWVDGEYVDYCYTVFLMRAGKVHNNQALPGESSPYMKNESVRPGVEFRAPKDYTGLLPEGCRWAEGSKPKNAPTAYQVLEGTFNGETWFEITHKNAMDAYLRLPLVRLHSSRVRTVDASGGTTWTDETCHVPAKPRPKADTPLSGQIVPTMATDDAVMQLREHVEVLAQILKRRWKGHANMMALEALIDRLAEDG